LNAQLAAQKLPFSWDPHLFGCYITWLYCCPLKTAIRFGFCDDINATTVYYGALVAKREAFRSSNYILMSCEKIFVPLSGGDRVKIVLKIFGYSFYREYFGGMMVSIKGDFILNSKRSFCYDFFYYFPHTSMFPKNVKELLSLNHKKRYLQVLMLSTLICLPLFEGGLAREIWTCG